MNIKELFSKAHGTKKRYSLGKALTKQSLEFEGIPHRGIDDAKNISRLLPFVFGKGSFE